MAGLGFEVHTTAKVLAYITHGRKLLVFRHVDFPEAGIQVPAGTVKDGESLEEAVLREAQEETGLEELKIVRYLGRARIDMNPFGKSEIHDRAYFHLHADTPIRERWFRSERDPSGGGNPVRFECFWVGLPDEVPELAARQDEFLHVVSGERQADRG